MCLFLLTLGAQVNMQTLGQPFKIKIKIIFDLKLFINVIFMFTVVNNKEKHGEVICEGHQYAQPQSETLGQLLSIKN